MREAILPGDPKQREGLELESLRRTRAAVAAKTMNVGLAVFCTTLVFCAVPPLHPVVELLRKGGAWAAAALLAAGAFFWWRFVKACQVLRATGLPPRRGIGPRVAWLAGGFLIFEALSAVILGWKGRPPQFYFVPVAGAFLAVWLGEKLHQVTPPQAPTLQTLFTPPDDDDPPGA